MKKISILALHLGYGGIEKSIVALANLLCDKYEVEIACVYQLFDTCVFELDKKVHVKYLNPGMKPNREAFLDALHHLRFLKTFAYGLESIKILWAKKNNTIQYIKETKCDVMISTRDILNEYLAVYGSKDTIKIGWEHNHFNNNMTNSEQVIRSAKELDYLVLVSQNIKKYYNDKLRKYPCKCVCIPNILDSMPTKLAPLKEKRLISIGRLSEEKGYLDLLKIFYLLHKDHPDWVLDIIGDGDQRKNLEQFIKQYKLTDFVTLHGFQSKSYIDNILQKSSIYIMTSHTESFGIVLIEAMSHGIPPVAFNSAEGARELIKSGDNGYLIKNRNFRAIMKKIEDLMENPEERKKIGKNARESIKKYNGEEVIKNWYKIIEKK